MLASNLPGTPTAADWTIRPCKSTDLPRLARVYQDSVRQLGAACYTPEQIAAWSAFAEDAPAFASWITEARTFVAADSDDAVIGFAGLDSGGRIASLYVSPDWMRQGIGSSLLATLLAKAGDSGLKGVRTEASYFSRPVFERHGFRVITEEYVRYGDVEFHRFVMGREVDPDALPPSPISGANHGQR